MERVVVIGPCGAGKSTFSTELAARTGLPLYHMDRLHWKPGWRESTRQELIDRLMPVMTTDRWIIDGNYGGTMELRFRHADTVIFLDLPPRLYRWRVVKRFLMYRNRSRPDMGEGCPERLDFEFLRYVWRFHRDKRPRLLERLKALDEAVTLIHLRSDREVRRFLESITTNTPGPPVQARTERAKPTDCNPWASDRGA